MRFLIQKVVPSLTEFILFISFIIILNLLFQGSHKIEKRAIQVDRSYLVNYLIKSELLHMIFATICVFFNILSIVCCEWFLTLHVLMTLIGAYIIVRSIVRIIRMLQDDRYLKITKTIFRDGKYIDGISSEDSGRYEIETNIGNFTVPKRFIKMSKNDRILIVSFNGNTNARMLLGMTKDVQCDIISDNDYRKNDKHKKNKKS